MFGQSPEGRVQAVPSALGSRSLRAAGPRSSLRGEEKRCEGSARCVVPRNCVGWCVVGEVNAVPSASSHGGWA